MLSSPRRLALSWRAVRRCSVRGLIRSGRSAILTSREPGSLSSRPYAATTSALFGSVADGTRCPFLILWISYSLMSLPDAERSAERSKPRKECCDRFDALPRVVRGRAAATGHHEKLSESGVDGRLRVLERLVRCRESKRDRPSDRRRVAAHLAGGGVERLVQRDRLLQWAGVPLPHGPMPSGEAQHPRPLPADP